MREQEQKSRAFWDAQADDAGDGMTPGLMVSDARLSEYRDLAEKKVFYERMGTLLDAQMRVLEVGCGSGRWTVDFANRFTQVMAADISPKILGHARNRAEREGHDNVTFQAESFERLDYGGRVFDMVYLGACLHYMSEEAIDEALSKLGDAISESAVLVSRDTVSTLGRTFHRSERYNTPDPAIYRPAKEYESMMIKHGWKLIDSWPTYVRPISWRLRFLFPGSLLQKLMGFEARHASFMVRHPGIFDRPGDKQHRFFIYER